MYVDRLAPGVVADAYTVHPVGIADGQVVHLDIRDVHQVHCRFPVAQNHRLIPHAVASQPHDSFARLPLRNQRTRVGAPRLEQHRISALQCENVHTPHRAERRLTAQTVVFVAAINSIHIIRHRYFSSSTF